MEDASGTDLDWFWRGWFYTTDHVDIAMTNVRWFTMDDQSPAAKKAYEKQQAEAEARGITYQRNAGNKTVVSEDSTMRDFYSKTDKYAVQPWEQADYERYYNSLSEEEKQLLNARKHFYELSFENRGGLIMPVILEFTFDDGSREVVRLPAEVWLRSEDAFTKVFVFDKVVTSIELDPFLETADTDRNNNYWPQRQEPTRFELYKRREWRRSQNPMQRAEE
jgi:hypothetical protein